MKTKIHPKYDTAKVSCACGNSFETRATVPEIKVDICSQCHPFYTGKQKLVDSAGRVEKFEKRWGKHIEAQKKALSGEAEKKEEE
jgi:large subunit ribosomal protein L31